METFLFLSIEVRKEVPAKVLRRVIEAHLLVHSINLLHVLGIQLEVSLQIRLDPAWGLRLGNDRSAVRNALLNI